MAEVCRLILNEEEFNLHEIDGSADLFHATREDLHDVVKRLNSKGLDLDKTDEGKTAVFYANQNCSLHALCALIQCDADFDLDEIDGKAALFHAAKEDYADVVFELDHQGLVLDITNDEGKTAVFYANQNHNMDVLCRLINCDAKFNLNKIDGKAALFHAAKEEYPNVVFKLKSQGFDLNITDDEDRTAVFYANHNHNMDALCRLMLFVALFHAAKEDDPNVVDRLDSKGLELKITDDEGRTAVFYANENHNMFPLCELIECGAKFNLDEIDGKAALFHAAKMDMVEVVKVLEDTGLDLNLTDDEGRTAVFLANQNHNLDIVCMLIGSLSKFNLDEIDGKSALFHAAKEDDPNVSDRLNSKGFDLNITDDEGRTAMFHANENQSMFCLCELIECGAKFNLDKIDGKDALFHATKMDMQEVVQPLYDAGLDLNVTDNDGKTVVFYCNKDFLDALIAVDEVLVNARDAYGRTPLFYAVRDDNTTKARHLIEKGGNLQLKDNCHLSIFSFFIEYCISKKIEAMQLFTSELFHEERQLEALTLAILDTVYCQAPLLSVSDSPHLPKSYTIFNKTNLLKVLAFAREQCLIQDNAENVDKIESMIRENEIDVPLILSLLNNLGGNPNAADLDGNTALHYASFLPFLGVTQEPVIEICKKLKKFGTLFDTKNHQRQSPLLFCLSSITLKVITEGNNWQSSIGGLVEVCRFLLSNGSGITNGSANVESIFHRIILLIQQGLQLNEEASRKAVCQVMIDVLKLLSPKKEAVRNAVNNTDTLLNSPLHLWASIAYKSPKDYTSFLTGEHEFERILRIILEHLLECGAKLNLRNENEQTPFICAERGPL
jgi:ankyrin repeat protein